MQNLQPSPFSSGKNADFSEADKQGFTPNKRRPEGSVKDV